jgi:hypothetical protein
VASNEKPVIAIGYRSNATITLFLHFVPWSRRSNTRRGLQDNKQFDFFGKIVRNQLNLPQECQFTLLEEIIIAGAWISALITTEKLLNEELSWVDGLDCQIKVKPHGIQEILALPAVHRWLLLSAHMSNQNSSMIPTLLIFITNQGSMTWGWRSSGLLLHTFNY